MVILIHSSKTMKPTSPVGVRSVPMYIAKARMLAEYLQSLPVESVAKHMQLSASLAQKTHDTFAVWSDEPAQQSPAVDCFVGDIYSGLRAGEFTAADKDYAQDHLRILSGLYGVLRPYDGIAPYRCEMAYRFADSPYDNLYSYWGDSIARTLPDGEMLLNVSSLEYMKAVLPYVDTGRVVTPQFLTVNAKTGEPTFVVVHAKIARGAMARWAVQHQVKCADGLMEFDDLGYKYSAALSRPNAPVFVCNDFGGIGLSVRLAR